MSHGDGQAHPVREARRGRFRGIEIRVGIEPHHPETPGAGDGPDQGVAVAREHQGELAVGEGGPDLGRDQAIQLEGGSNLGRRHLFGTKGHGGRLPPRSPQRIGEPVAQEMLRPGAHP